MNHSQIRSQTVFVLVSCCDSPISLKLRKMSSEASGKSLPAPSESRQFVTCRINGMRDRCKQKQMTTGCFNLFPSNNFCLLGRSCQRPQWSSTFSLAADRSGCLSHFSHINANAACVCESWWRQSICQQVAMEGFLLNNTMRLLQSHWLHPHYCIFIWLALLKIATTTKTKTPLEQICFSSVSETISIHTKHTSHIHDQSQA